MEGNRTAPYGYDAGYPDEDLTTTHKSGDNVKIKVKLEQILNRQGVPDLIGHIESIDKLNAKTI